MRRLDRIKTHLAGEADGQLSVTDRDARSMISQAKGTGTVGYNVQTAVDAKHHLIVEHEVTNVGSDRAQLPRPRGDSTRATSSTSPRTMSTSAPQVSARPIASRARKMACSCVAIGAAPARSAR
jgi:hypothetical protein